MVAQEPADPLAPAAIQERIRAHRTASVVLKVQNSQGKPLANTPVVVKQTRHRFLFGSNAFVLDMPDKELQRLYRERFVALFNSATLPFYWGAYESKQGQPDAERLRGMARWCVEHGITIKGHPLCWHQVTPSWLADKPYDETLRLELDRIRRDVSAFAGLIDRWDVVNEAVSMPTFSRESPVSLMCVRVGQMPLIKQAFAAARAANPKAVLALNDFDTTPRYESLTRDALAAGADIDVLGIQSHMHHGFLGDKALWDICERFAKFGKPLHWTEVTIIAGPRQEKLDYSKRYEDWSSTPEGEKLQAEQAEQFYTLVFSHPAVEAITWWDLSDHEAWLGAPAGLLRKDMTPRPAYEALQKLIKGQWWTAEVRACTDAAGQVRFRGFLGSYVVESPGGKARFALERPGEVRVDAKVVAPR
jgi:GH35 family endo-1,4-beta-xylanase